MNNEAQAAMVNLARTASDTIAKVNVALEAGASGYVLGWEANALFIRFAEDGAPSVGGVFHANVYATPKHAPQAQFENGNKDIAKLVTRKAALLATRASAERTLQMLEEIVKEG